jgi:hypothetical protein
LFVLSIGIDGRRPFFAILFSRCRSSIRLLRRISHKASSERTIIMNTATAPNMLGYSKSTVKTSCKRGAATTFAAKCASMAQIGAGFLQSLYMIGVGGASAL